MRRLCLEVAKHTTGSALVGSVFDLRHEGAARTLREQGHTRRAVDLVPWRIAAVLTDTITTAELPGAEPQLPLRAGG